MTFRLEKNVDPVFFQVKQGIFEVSHVKKCTFAYNLLNSCSIPSPPSGPANPMALVALTEESASSTWARSVRL